MNVVIPKVTIEDYNNAPKNIELFCRTGFENIKNPSSVGGENANEPGKTDYIHVKLNKSFVTFKVVGCHKNEEGEVSISARKIKAKEIKSESPEEIRVKTIKAQLEELDDAIDEANSDIVRNALMSTKDDLMEELSELEDIIDSDPDEDEE